MCSSRSSSVLGRVHLYGLSFSVPHTLLNSLAQPCSPTLVRTECPPFSAAFLAILAPRFSFSEV